MLDVRNLSVRYGGLTVVDRVSFAVEPGRWLMLVGPNGAGKSTIVNAVSCGVPYTGEILLAGKSVLRYKPYELARRLGVLMQSHSVSYAYTVGEVVRLGRYAYAPSAFSPRCKEDAAAVDRAIAETGLTPLINQSVLQLSGGELQRVFLAQLFAQNPSLLLLDEPTNHLDLVYQKQTFALLSEWVRVPGRAIVSVVHDLSLAARYGTHALLLNRGKTVAYGEMADVLTRENLARAYDMDVFSWMQTLLKQWNTGEEGEAHGFCGAE